MAVCGVNGLIRRRICEMDFYIVSGIIFLVLAFTFAFGFGCGYLYYRLFIYNIDKTQEAKNELGIRE